MIPPGDAKARRALEREADALLEAGYQDRIQKTGRMNYLGGQHVWSLDQREDGFGVEAGPDLWLGVAPEYDTEAVVQSAVEDAGLTRSEAELVEAVADGAEVGVYGWSEPLADRFRKSEANIRQTWSTSKRKLIKHWGNQPEPRDRSVLRSSKEGNGHTLFIGVPVLRGPRVNPAEVPEAMLRHAQGARRNRDWRYQRSLTEDGWQLGDDNLWGDWTPTSQL